MREIGSSEELDPNNLHKLCATERLCARVKLATEMVVTLTIFYNYLSTSANLFLNKRHNPAYSESITNAAMVYGISVE